MGPERPMMKKAEQQTGFFLILRILRAESRLTVYCPLDIPKLLWDPMGFGPKAICIEDPRKLRIEEENDSTVPGRFLQVLVCIYMLPLNRIPQKCS